MAQTDSRETPPALEAVGAYHERTKHFPNRFARSLGFMDWDTQPDPFRRYHGSPLVELPFAEESASALYESLYAQRPAPRPVTYGTIGAVFEHALGLSAWKQYKTAQWTLRCNPSSGNLHPTESYLITGPVAGLCASSTVFHYAPKEHALEGRCVFADETWAKLCESFPESTFFVGLSSIFWRESWKYGERAYRYCQHDAGHAIAAVALSAAAQGWKAIHLSGLSDAEAAAMLGLDRDGDFPEEPLEREEPDALLAIVPDAPGATVPRRVDAAAVTAIAESSWTGRANDLSGDHVDWPIIHEVAEAATKPATNEPDAELAERPAPVTSGHECPLGFNAIAKQRRSAVEMDAETPISRDAFYTMLARTLPRDGAVPFDTLGAPRCVHLGLFVHRVDGLAPGAYCLLREPDSGERLRAAMTKPFEWQTPEGCPEGLPLYRLAAEDCRRAAAMVSCGQAIAGDGAFSLGMIADFQRALETHGPWFYRRLFWETGVVGQVLYLEAEAAGVRSTGIGCFFDDPVHQLFGLKDTAFQSLYHFTVGGHLDDPRLQTLPPYEERE